MILQFGYSRTQKIREVSKGGQRPPFGSGSSKRGESIPVGIGDPKGPQPLGTLTLLARSSVFYTLAQEDGVDRCFHTFSPRRFPAYPSPQQRDTRSLSAFQKRIYGNWAKKLRTYVPTNPSAESSTNGSVGVLLTGDYLVQRLEEHLLRLPFSKSS